jgi:hypothetical protein
MMLCLTHLFSFWWVVADSAAMRTPSWNAVLGILMPISFSGRCPDPIAVMAWLQPVGEPGQTKGSSRWLGTFLADQW